ncbi:serine protease 56 [Oncorhynchus masou masou]|uniref:serine protease 56 n=1 Tax=Oncorhynchus masou masou TaxID=90313 RepID=UPI0031838FF3
MRLASLDGILAEPSCDVITKAQKVPEEGERSWALSQACGYYRRRCPPGEKEREACVRIMGESCSARVLQCSLLNTMQNLEPATQTRTQAAVCGQRLSAVQNVTQPRSRIVGGSPALPGSWPWLVNLQLDGGLMCGGVLVDSTWVVTAAHCFAGSRSDSYWTAVVGEFDITKTDPDEQVLKVNRIISHPKFNPKTFNNDIALVELTSPVVLSDRVTPVCLPSGLEPPTGSPCLVAGWGSLYEDGPSADVVMEAKVPLLPQSTCKSSLGKELVTNTMLCAGYLSGGIDSCQGDSGGPLIYQDRISGRFQLHGITSWGDGCGEKGKPGVYTRVSAFSDWILAEIQSNSFFEATIICHAFTLLVLKLLK